jgi:hypothetical protein
LPPAATKICLLELRGSLRKRGESRSLTISSFSNELIITHLRKFFKRNEIEKIFCFSGEFFYEIEIKKNKKKRAPSRIGLCKGLNYKGSIIDIRLIS